MDRKQKKELNRVLGQHSTTLAGILLYLYGIVQIIVGVFAFLQDFSGSSSNAISMLFFFFEGAEEAMQMMTIVIAVMLVFSGFVSISLGGILNKSRQSHHYLQLLIEKEYRESIGI